MMTKEELVKKLKLINISELSRRAGVHRNTVNRMLKNPGLNTRKSTIDKLATAIEGV